jgi:hypothetical protein
MVFYLFRRIYFGGKGKIHFLRFTKLRNILEQKRNFYFFEIRQFCITGSSLNRIEIIYMDCASNKVFDLVINCEFQQWVRNNFPLREFCSKSELEIMEEAATIIRLLENQKRTFSQQTIDRNYKIVLNKILLR